MIFSNKCALEKKQILSAIKDGFKYIEFHTNLKHFNYSIDEIIEIRRLLDENNITCVALHLPIESNNENPDYISIPTYNDYYRNKFIELSKKAIDYISILSGAENPIVVSHIGTSYFYNPTKPYVLNKNILDKKLRDAKEDLLVISKYAQETDDSILFVVENVPLFTETKNGMASWCFGTGFELVDFIKNINKKNIKACLDICHAESTIRISNIINHEDNFRIEDYIYQFKDVIGHIHLNNTINIGSTKENHSVAFKSTSEDKAYLKRIISSIIKNKIQCSITLEINEDDYDKRINIKTTKETLNKVLSDLRLELI